MLPCDDATLCATSAMSCSKESAETFAVAWYHTFISDRGSQSSGRVLRTRSLQLDVAPCVLAWQPHVLSDLRAQNLETLLMLCSYLSGHSFGISPRFDCDCCWWLERLHVWQGCFIDDPLKLAEDACAPLFLPRGTGQGMRSFMAL